MNFADFKHITELRVRNYEVDWQGIVHNANYLLYFEVGRIEYLKHIGIPINLSSIQSDSKIVLVRNEVNYRSSARFDDLLKVYSRISYIRESSFAFEGLLIHSTEERLVAENLSIHVWLDPVSGLPRRVGADFRERIRAFEGAKVLIPDVGSSA